MSDPSQSKSRRRGRLPRSEREARFQQILDSAAYLVAKHGYSATKMQDIADHAEASKETLYAWFGSKEGLVSALIERNARTSTVQLERALNKPPDNVAEVRTILIEHANALLRLLMSDISIQLNRASIGSPVLAESLLNNGRHLVGPIAEKYFQNLYEERLIAESDASQAYSRFIGLVVQDTQIRLLLGEQTLPDQDIESRAIWAVDAFLRLHRNASEQ